MCKVLLSIVKVSIHLRKVNLPMVRVATISLPKSLTTNHNRVMVNIYVLRTVKVYLSIKKKLLIKYIYYDTFEILIRKLWFCIKCSFKMVTVLKESCNTFSCIRYSGFSVTLSLRTLIIIPLFNIDYYQTSYLLYAFRDYFDLSPLIGL